MARVDCWSCKNLPSRLDEEMLEKMLMAEGSKSHQLQMSGPLFSSCAGHVKPEGNPGIRELRGAVQRKWRRLGSNIAGAVHSFTQVMALQPQRDVHVNDEQKLAWNGVVEALMQRHPGSQLPERLILLIRRHFELMPMSYAQARFDSEQVFTHIRLLEQARLERSNLPPVAIQELTSNASEGSSGSSSPFSFESGDEEDRNTTEVVVSFACAGSFYKAAIHWAFKRANIYVKDIQLFVTKAQSLGVIEARCLQAHLHQKNLQSAVKSAARRTRLMRLTLGLCKSKSSGHSEAVNSNLMKEEKTMGNGGKAVDSGDSYIEVNRCSFASTLNEIPSPSTLLQILLDDQEIMPGDGYLDNWLLDFRKLEIVKPIKKCSFGRFIVYEGIYNHEKVTVKHWKEHDHLTIPALELRRELSILTLSHKNILPFMGFCVDSQHSLYTVTKFMEGGSLQDLIQKNSKIELRDMLKFSKDIAEGIMFLHQHGVIHGYLTTENVLINGRENAVVGGMGVGEQSGAKSNTYYEQGAYRSMAPEVLSADSAITAKTDVHSLGIIMTGLLSCLKSPLDLFPPESGEGAELEHLHHCFRVLRNLIQRCCAGNPLQRPNMHEVLNSLSMIQNSRIA
ncbi:hypothetical protein O6H91_07G120700 [Diphasiastrum complanatum]|uniref:Uncharacterized protein n=1 Tax=Diphasiastrum complanatum TaxID=34168 RepID=A0ACC2D9E8_DIPCM|nr:hypothetical protein O6H91_07G120700 [Diphasiastrum complanatum]